MRCCVSRDDAAVTALRNSAEDPLLPIASPSPLNINVDDGVTVSLPTKCACLATWLGCSLLNQIVHSPWCNLMFGCGCRALWNGGWRDCNVHRTDGGPRCPWCVLWMPGNSNMRWYSLFNTAIDQDGFPVLAMTFAALFALRNRNEAAHPLLIFVCTLLAVAIAYTASSSAAGFVWGRAYSYPYFFGGNFTEVSVPVKPGNPRVSAASLLKTIAIGVWGGCFWSAALVAAPAALYCFSSFYLFYKEEET